MEDRNKLTLADLPNISMNLCKEMLDSASKKYAISLILFGVSMLVNLVTLIVVL